MGRYDKELAQRVVVGFQVGIKKALKERMDDMDSVMLRLN